MAATPLRSAHPCWIKKKKPLFFFCLGDFFFSFLFRGIHTHTAVRDTHTHTHRDALTAAEMSEEVKEKAAGKSAHRKKKGKKVKQV